LVHTIIFKQSSTIYTEKTLIVPRRHRHRPLFQGTFSLPLLKGQPSPEQAHSGQTSAAASSRCSISAA